MQLSETALNILFGIVIAIMIAVNYYVRKNKSGQSPLGRVVGIYADVNKNLKMLGNSELRWEAGKLKNGQWEKNKDKIDFVPLEIRQTVARAFVMVDDVNQRIADARRHKSSSYMAGIDMAKLREPLARSGEQLEAWLRENLQNPEFQPRRRGMFG